MNLAAVIICFNLILLLVLRVHFLQLLLLLKFGQQAVVLGCEAALAVGDRVVQGGVLAARAALLLPAEVGVVNLGIAQGILLGLLGLVPVGAYAVAHYGLVLRQHGSIIDARVPLLKQD